MQHAGIDISKRSMQVSVLDERGEMVKSPTSLPVDQKGLSKLVDILTEASRNKNEIQVGMEATGNLWENVYSHLEKEEYTVKLINPHQSRKFHQLARRKAKTDKIDSVVIAGLLRSGEVIESYVPEDNVQPLRELVRLRHSLQKTKKAVRDVAPPFWRWCFLNTASLLKIPLGWYPA